MTAKKRISEKAILICNGLLQSASCIHIYIQTHRCIHTHTHTHMNRLDVILMLNQSHISMLPGVQDG